MKKSTLFNLLAAVILVPTLAAPVFAADGKGSPGRSTETMQTMSSDRPLLTPYPRQWWKDN